MFTRKAFMKYLNNLEHEPDVAKPCLDKPFPSYDGAVCVEGIDYRVYIDCVLSDYEYEGVEWITWVMLYDEDKKKYCGSWGVLCDEMEDFVQLVNDMCKCMKLDEIVKLLEGSEWCES